MDKKLKSTFVVFLSLFVLVCCEPAKETPTKQEKRTYFSSVFDRSSEIIEALQMVEGIGDLGDRHNQLKLEIASKKLQQETQKGIKIQPPTGLESFDRKFEKALLKLDSAGSNLERFSVRLEQGEVTQSDKKSAMSATRGLKTGAEILLPLLERADEYLTAHPPN